MHIETFKLERTQSLWENTVDYNLTETGVHPFTLEELLTPEDIASMLSLRLGYGQTNGSIALRETIASLYSNITCDEILVTNGSIEANFVAMWNLLEPGDELVLMLPNYMQIHGVANAFGVKVRPFYLHETESGWRIDIEEIRSLMSPKVRMIAICNPNNPTGSVLTDSEMDAIVRLADSVGAWLYVDEIYRGAELSGKETPTFLGRYDKVIVAGGLSKAYALPGLRIGWLAGPRKVVDDCWARRDYLTIATSMLSNYIAAIALKEEVRTQILARNRSMLHNNLTIITDWIDSQSGHFTFIPPGAGGMAFMKYDFDINSTVWVERLREEQSTFIVAGDCFGMDGRVRIGIGSEAGYLREGLRRINDDIQMHF
ncbi:aminotransferase class I/II-fold pyridoxal phosphate-dependent enzyme [bacterium]|nr:aminotransferase class I/II-fold pyridoxal phosphate-dependent enzyme [bacterium]